MLQIFCVVTPIVLSILHHNFTPAITKVGLCFLSSLNPIAAFCLGLNHIINAEINSMLYLNNLKNILK
jgi:hypothetical protein